MCRNIKTLHNFKPPATDAEIRASALQFVRKLGGFTRPSKANQFAFERAVDAVARTARELLDALVTAAPPRNRDDEAVKARARAAERYRSVANTATANAGEQPERLAHNSEPTSRVRSTERHGEQEAQGRPPC